jgi:hypothetical protein
MYCINVVMYLCACLCINVFLSLSLYRCIFLSPLSLSLSIYIYIYTDKYVCILFVHIYLSHSSPLWLKNVGLGRFPYSQVVPTQLNFLSGINQN